MKISALIQNAEFKQRIEEKMKKTNIIIDFVKNEEPLIPQIKNTEILINSFNKIDKKLIDFCPNLKLVQQSGIGVDGIDIEYCTSKDIYVANVPLANAISVAEHTFLLMLYLSKNIKLDPIQSISSTGKFVRRAPEKMGFELQGKNLLIIGLGVTGIEVAKRAKAFGMKVTAITKHPFTKTVGGDKKYYVDYLYGSDKLVEVLPNADVVTIHTPLNQETENMIGKSELDLMKDSAYLVNVARAPIVSKEALLKSLEGRNIAGAAFDVFWTEPADTDDPLLKLENFVLTPHLAGWTYEAIDSITDIMFMNFERMMRGQIPMTIVNKR